MNAKSYIPFLTVPLAMVMLAILTTDALRGRFDPRMDLPRYIVWGSLCTIWLITGLIKWNRPYVTVDETGVTVRGRWFSNRPSLAVPWGNIRRHTGREWSTFGIESVDGKITKIPINGISGKALESLLAKIQERTETANQQVQPIAGKPGSG